MELNKVKDILFRKTRAEFRGGITDIPPPPPEYIKDVYPECDMFGDLPASAYFLRHTENVVFENCITDVPEADAREKILDYGN